MDYKYLYDDLQYMQYAYNHILIFSSWKHEPRPANSNI
jgi:hypothetical protein